jgi:flagellar basal-body rod protein FlgB
MIFQMVQNISENTYSLLKRSLDASAERGRVIAHNIANVNTKGYKALKVKFEEKLQETLQGNSVNLIATHENHIKDSSSETSYEIVKDNSSSMKLDGNNVDIDNEMTNLSANNIMYNALISQANSRLSMRRYIISGGSK